MTQTARPPRTPWLVPPGDIGDIEHKSFTLVCRGHVEIGKVLGFLVYRASWVAKNEGIDWTEVPAITVECEHKDILAKVTISQNSLITYIKQLAAWGYIKADGYRHRYAVSIQIINETIANPPVAFPKKPRGKAAPKKEPSAEAQAQERQEKATKLKSQLSNLETTLSNLETRITKLKSQLSNLETTKEAEGTREQGVTPVFEADRIKGTLQNRKESSFVISPDGESDEGNAFLSRLSSFGENLEENRKTPLDPSPLTKSESRPEESSRVIPEPTPVMLQVESTRITPTQVALIPTLLVSPLSSEGGKNAPSPYKTDGKEKNKKRLSIKECSPEIQERRRKWQAYFNQRRGGELLPLKGGRINESECIAFLVDTYTDMQIKMIDNFVLAERFPYKKPSERHRAGGRVILDEAQNAREFLKELGRWPARDAPAGQMPEPGKPTMVMDPYTAKILQLNAERKAAFERSQAQVGVAL